MMKLNSVETEYLLTVLRAAANGEKPAAPPEGIDWNEFFELSKKQQVYSMVVQAVDINCLPPQIADMLNNFSKSELVRLIAMQNELAAIKVELEKSKIKYMLLKGSLIKNYYPKQSMRQMSDIDVLYDPDKRDSLVEIMTARGYELLSQGGNSDDFSKQPYYTFEFHRALFKDVYGFCPDFSFVWDNAQKSADSQYEYIMSVEDLYLHHIAHMYKHCILGGFGIRFIVDTYLILKNNAESMDRSYLDDKLAQMQLSDFEKDISSFTFALMENKELSEKQREFFDTALVHGIYGDYNTNVGEAFRNYKNKNGGSAFGYVMSRIFPSVFQMKSMYPILKKHPVLLGFYYIKRLVEKSFTSRKKALNEVRAVRKINEEQKNK